MSNMRRRKRSTELEYRQIYEKRLSGWPLLTIAQEFACSLRKVADAIRYCQGFVLDFTDKEHVQLLVDAKNWRISRLEEQIEELKDGWDWEETHERVIDGSIWQLKRSGTKIAPSAIIKMFGEIRQLENDIAQLLGLLKVVEAEETLDSEELAQATMESILDIKRQRGRYEKSKSDPE